MAPRTNATKRRHLNSSAEKPPLPTLPFDLVEDILQRLPVKSLAQFKSVCKSWKSLISDSKFTKKHFRVSPTCHRLLFPKLTKGQYIFNACTLSSLVTTKGAATTMQQLESPLNIRKFDQIRGSCHGILCIQLHQRFAILWNPFVNKYASLPPLEIPWSNTIYSCFGYDHSTDSYKVVAFIKWMPNSEVYKTFVHTMGTTSWKKIQDFPCTRYSESGKFVSGTFNWLAYKDSVSSLVIVSLDLEKETYQKLLKEPDYGEVDVLSKSLWVLRDCLSILANTNTFSDVWLMKEYGNQDSWTRLFRVPYMGGVGSSDPYTKALYVYEDDQVLLEYMMKLVVYNSRDGTFKTLKIQRRRDWMIPEVCQESLVSPCAE